VYRRTSLWLSFMSREGQSPNQLTQGDYATMPYYFQLAEIWQEYFVRLAHNWGFEGFADHVVSEALYLHGHAHPDGHGIEIYTDKPLERWLYNSERVEIFLLLFGSYLCVSVVVMFLFFLGGLVVLMMLWMFLLSIFLW